MRRYSFAKSRGAIIFILGIIFFFFFFFFFFSFSVLTMICNITRMVSEGFDLIILQYVFGQTGPSKRVDPNQMPQNVTSDQDLLCLPLTQQFYTNLLLVKCTC